MVVVGGASPLSSSKRSEPLSPRFVSKAQCETPTVATQRYAKIERTCKCSRRQLAPIWHGTFRLIFTRCVAKQEIRKRDSCFHFDMQINDFVCIIVFITNVDRPRRVIRYILILDFKLYLFPTTDDNDINSLQYIKRLSKDETVDAFFSSFRTCKHSGVNQTVNLYNSCLSPISADRVVAHNRHLLLCLAGEPCTICSMPVGRLAPKHFPLFAQQ